VARLAQSDRASDSYDASCGDTSEGCEFDPRGGLVNSFSIRRASSQFGFVLVLLSRIISIQVIDNKKSQSGKIVL
jgi:hypothetical protein